MIKPVPQIEEGIIEAINDKKIAVFIGAGCSRLIGCRGWGQLAENLIRTCFETEKPDGKRCINFKEKDTLSQNTDYKKVISICHGILEKNGHEEIFFEKLEESFEEDDVLIKTFNIYKELYNFLHDSFSGLSGIFITTNADEHFDSEFSRSEIVSMPEDFNISDSSPLRLYHIHGSISNRESLVFTVNQYIERYNHENFREVLNKIFNEYTVLFLGYGLEEFEILDFLISKLKLDKRSRRLRNFILLPYYSGEENILDFDQIYYNNLGIKVLGYCKDENGYNQLYYVIKKWNEDKSNLLSHSYDSYKDLDEVIEEHERSKK
jgi:hypothetical protein